jgi:hypothetical protein
MTQLPLDGLPAALIPDDDTDLTAALMGLAETFADGLNAVQEREQATYALVAWNEAAQGWKVTLP